MWPTFDQDLTNRLVKCNLKRGRSKVSLVDYPLTNIRLIISGQCYECNFSCSVEPYTIPVFSEGRTQGHKSVFAYLWLSQIGFVRFWEFDHYKERYGQKIIYVKSSVLADVPCPSHNLCTTSSWAAGLPVTSIYKQKLYSAHLPISIKIHRTTGGSILSSIGAPDIASVLQFTVILLVNSLIHFQTAGNLIIPNCRRSDQAWRCQTNY